jgi:hypothetical protein
MTYSLKIPTSQCNMYFGLCMQDKLTATSCNFLGFLNISEPIFYRHILISNSIYVHVQEASTLCLVIISFVVKNLSTLHNKYYNQLQTQPVVDMNRSLHILFITKLAKLPKNYWNWRVIQVVHIATFFTLLNYTCVSNKMMWMLLMKKQQMT